MSWFNSQKKNKTNDDGEECDYKPRTRDKVRDKLPKDKQMGGEDTDPWKGKAPKDPWEYEQQRRQIEDDKRSADIGGAGSPGDAQ